MRRRAAARASASSLSVRAPLEQASGRQRPHPSRDGTNRKEHVIHAHAPKPLKLLAATALAVAALGTPLAQAATDLPPGPGAQAASEFPPGPGAQAATDLPPGPGAQAATDLPPGPNAQAATDYPPGPGAQAAIIAI
jgi:hypothetical protein